MKNHQGIFLKEQIISQMQVIPVKETGVKPIDFETLSVVKGHLFINGELTDSYCKGDYISWVRTKVNGEQESGFLRMMQNRPLARGIVNQEGKDIHFIATGLVDYNCTLDSGKTTWFEFGMGFQPDENGNQHVVGKLIEPRDAKKTDELSKHTSTLFTVTKNKAKEIIFHGEIEFNPGYVSLGGSKWITAEFDFAIDYSSFSGTLYEYDPEKPAYKGKAHQLSGVCKDQKMLNSMFEAIDLKNEPDEKVSGQLQSMVAIWESIPVTVEELFDLPAPDLPNVHTISFSKMKNLMLYSIDDQWRNWFGQTKPNVGPGEALSEADASLADKDKHPHINNFLVNRFAIGYLTQAFLKSTDSKITDKFNEIPNHEEKLAYFWKGGGKGSFSKDKGYNEATSSLMNDTYAENVPGLQPYLLDDPSDWAKKLYDFCMKGVTLNGLAMQNTLDGRKRLTHLSMILHALDHTTKITKKNGRKVIYSTALYEKVMDYRMNYVIKRSMSSHKDSLTEFLTEYYRQYFKSLLEGDKWEDSIRAEAGKELAEMMEKFGAESVNELVGKMGSIIGGITDVMVGKSKLPTPARIRAWGKAHPKISKLVGGGLTMATYCFGIYQSVQALMNWENLKPEQKVQAVATMLDVSVSMFNDFATFKMTRALANATSSFDEAIEALKDIGKAMDEESILGIGDNLSISLDPELSELSAPALAGAGPVAAEEAADGFANSASKWADISNIGSRVAIGMNIIALGASCVVTGFQIANDFETNQSTAVKTFDILEESAMGVAFLAASGEAIAIVVGIEVCSAIPVIGAVAAFVGIGIAIASLFIHRDPPPTPQEKFVDDHCKPFITSLEMPSLEWLAKQKKLTDHLAGKSTAAVL